MTVRVCRLADAVRVANGIKGLELTALEPTRAGCDMTLIYSRADGARAGCAVGRRCVGW